MWPFKTHLPLAEKYYWKLDKEFEDLYLASLKASGKKDRSATKERSYVLQQYLKLVLTRFPSVNVAECGVFTGSTAYQICSLLRPTDTYVGLDSFEGLPARGIKDATANFPEGSSKGEFMASKENVAAILSSSKANVSLCQGWIPQVLSTLPEKEYHFIHLDVDLYEPTLGSLEYFYPKMKKGGIIICDDYGFTAWPGAKKALEKFNMPFISLPTGQAVIEI